MADNSSRKFKFISPGVFIDEIDNSQLPATPAAVGPVVVGMAAKGPGMTPVSVSSFSEFVEVFGEPIAGADAKDVWRSGKPQGPTYGAYAAQAWLRNNSPITYMRLHGVEDSDASTAGRAGWKAGTLGSNPSQGGAFGLFVFPSGNFDDAGSNPANGFLTTGSLASVFYCTEGRVVISGAMALTGRVTASACALFQSDTNGDVTLGFSTDGTVANMKLTTINLNPAKENFIRNVLNTNPTVTNDSITSTGQQAANLGGEFWLGESYENQLVSESTDSIGVLSGDIRNSEFHCAILPLRNQKTEANVHNDRNYPAQKASTGFFLAQDLGTNTSVYDPASMQKLFRIEALSAGSTTQNDIKISIVDIKAPQGDFELYGSFGLLVRKMSDTDENQVVLERYDGLNLDPASPNYIAKKIGDQFEEYDAAIKLNRVYGTYANKSRYIRVAMDEDVDRGAHKEACLPFGVYGPLKYRNCDIISGSGKVIGFGASRSTFASASARVASMVDGGIAAVFGNMGGHPKTLGLATDNDIVQMNMRAPVPVDGNGYALSSLSASIKFPQVPLRAKSTWGKSKNLKTCFWGAYSGKSPTDTKFNEEVIDLLRPPARTLQGSPSSVDHDVETGLPLVDSDAAVPTQANSTTDPLVISWTFSLDDVKRETDGTLTYSSGSRLAGESLSAISSSYTGTLDGGVDRFTTFLAGGSDGFDITERDPFRLGGFTDASDEKESYQLHTLKRAVNILSDSDTTQYNLITMPGITQENATQHLLDTVEERGDALAIIDIRKVYQPDTENANSAKDRNSFTVKQAVDQLKARNINNSYGAAYAPWVMIQDTVSNRTLWAPPSVVALGVLSNTDRQQAPWFAPAGFQRGGLSEGAAGLPVLDVSKRLTSDERDRLYEANINPIAKFPAEGIVVFGQKTLQQTASALDRINVRRLMVFLKREISFIASRLLFEQNTRDTWDRFVSEATPLLDSVRAQFGIDDFRLILDESTTTPDLIDRNIIYSKLLVKPTRTAEFFAIDFVITNSGASFED